MCISVLLPLPELPMIATYSPDCTVAVIPLRAWTAISPTW